MVCSFVTKHQCQKPVLGRCMLPGRAGFLGRVKSLSPANSEAPYQPAAARAGRLLAIAHSSYLVPSSRSRRLSGTCRGRAQFLQDGLAVCNCTHSWPLRCQAAATCVADPDDYFHNEDDPDEYSLESDAGAPQTFQPSRAAELQTQAWAAWHNQKDSTAAKASEAAEQAGAAEALKRLGGRVSASVRFLVSVPGQTAQAVWVSAEAAGELLKEAALETEQTLKVASRKAVRHAKQSKMGKAVGEAQKSLDETMTSLPEGVWGKVMWLWERPAFKRLRITISMANLSVRLPALLALVATQVGLLASQVSLPMLAPLLLGTGMLLRSIRANASLIFPRVGLIVVLLWVLWFANSVVQNTVTYLRRQAAVDERISAAVITTTECFCLMTAFIVVLSMLGVNVSGLLIPAGLAMAFAAKDLSHNFFAGFFLFAVQPFRLGDRVAVSYSSPAAAGNGPGTAWFEGVCEKVDLRYTTLKNGRRRLLVPNSAFITREFMIVDEGDGPPSSLKRDLGYAPPQYPPSPPPRFTWGPAPSHPHPYYDNSGAHALPSQVPEQPDADVSSPSSQPAATSTSGTGNDARNMHSGTERDAREPSTSEPDPSRPPAGPYSNVTPINRNQAGQSPQSSGYGRGQAPVAYNGWYTEYPPYWSDYSQGEWSPPRKEEG